MEPTRLGLVLDTFVSGRKAQDISTPQNTSCSRLSKRETQVLRFIGLGYSNKEIGHTLFLSSHTIKTHIDSIKKKLRCHKATQLAVLAERFGLLRGFEFHY